MDSISNSDPRKDYNFLTDSKCCACKADRRLFRQRTPLQGPDRLSASRPRLKVKLRHNLVSIGWTGAHIGLSFPVALGNAVADRLASRASTGSTSTAVLGQVSPKREYVQFLRVQEEYAAAPFL